MQTTQTCLKKIVHLAQCFGYFPTQDNYFSMPYALFTLIGSLILTIMQITKAYKSLDLNQIEHIAQYISSAYVSIAFMKLALNWPKVMQQWSQVEAKMVSYGLPARLNRRIVVLMWVFMGLFAVEYVLHQSSRVYRAVQYYKQDEQTAINFFFANLSLSHVFKLIPYNVPTSVVFQYWYCQMKFGFTYTDLFVMVICVCLTSRFEQVTARIRTSSKKMITNKLVWRTLRKDYTRLVTLTYQVNDSISDIILISFLPNVFTILTQMYATITPKENLVETVYFYFSLLFLVSRTVTVCICGAMVHEESLRPVDVLNSVSYRIYNEEIDIFIIQLLNSEVSIHGKNLFKVKRHLILKLAGAIVTYELALLQFTGHA